MYTNFKVLSMKAYINQKNDISSYIFFEAEGRPEVIQLFPDMQHFKLLMQCYFPKCFIKYWYGLSGLLFQLW